MKIINQTINLNGFVSNIEIEPDEFLLPLQEVIVNAIQSIEDKDDISKSSIGINIIREQQEVFDKNEFGEPYKPIVSFEVTDNGVGFTNKRFKAFNEIYTDINKAKGCKGVGRYSVLACFGSMNVDSIYIEDGQYCRRVFKFTSRDGVIDETDNQESEAKKSNLSTKVSLNNYKKEFYDAIIKNQVTDKDIAESIIHHCLLYFVSEDIPLIRVFYDGDKENAIVINDLYKDVIKLDRAPDNITLNKKGELLTLNYIKDYSTRSHALFLCANKREVGKKIPLSTYIPSFVKAITDDDNGKYYLSIYATGTLLDEKVNSQRTKFALPKNSDDKTQFDTISISEICDVVSKDICTKYDHIISVADKEKNDRIRDYILNKNRPRLAYRHLLDVDGAFSDIPANATEEKIENELHKKSFHLEQKRTKAFDKAFAKKKYDKDEFSEIIQSVLSEEARFSADKLADLMIRRKSVIKLFRKYLDWRVEDQTYMLEKDLHNIIFTMGAETDTIPQEYHNLWLLDERLTYHRFTTSDRAMCTNRHINSDSQKETDLLVYDFPWAYTDNPNNVNSLVIFEFKRPGRDMNTSDDKDLDSQVVGYFQKLLESKATSNKGRLLNIQKNTPKFGYVICDTHKDLIEYNIDFNGFMPTPYGTLFKMNEKLNMYIEVMTYETMLEFAEKRHESFFRALGINDL